MAQLFAKDGGRWTKVAAGGSGGFRCPTSGVVSRFAQVRCAALRLPGPVCEAGRRVYDLECAGCAAAQLALAAATPIKPVALRGTGL